MNKTKMGLFLKELRKKKGLSLEKLSDEFLKDNLIVSENAISSWENGKTIPDIDNLCFLSTLYGVSIDEILDGSKANLPPNKKYMVIEDLYFCGMEEFEDFFSNDISTNDYKIMIRNNFKTLVRYAVSGDLTIEGKSELKHLIAKFYRYKTINNFYEFFERIENKKRYLSFDELWWELSKLVEPMYHLMIGAKVNPGYIFKIYKNDDWVKDYLKSIDDWEKDFLLIYALYYPDSYLKSDMLNDSAINEESDSEILKIIRLLIDNGACLSDLFTIGNSSLFRENVHNHHYIDIYLEWIKNQHKVYLLRDNNHTAAFLNDKYGSSNKPIDVGNAIERINKGIYSEQVIDKNPILIDDYKDLWDRLLMQKDSMSFADYNASRNQKRTMYLLSRLDDISVSELKDFVLKEIAINE